MASSIMQVLMFSHVMYFCQALLLWGSRSKQIPNFVTRTVMVRDNDVESALKQLNGILAVEDVTKRWFLTRRYEKPTTARGRINYERSKAVYNEDQARRMQFILRKNRRNPYPGVD